MSHLTTELCEKYPGERIQPWEYEIEATEWVAVGFIPTAFAEGKRLRLPKACYFSQAGTKEDVLLAWNRIKSRLGRNVKLECTIGSSFGKDLEPYKAPPRTEKGMQTTEAPPAVPLEDALSSAFTKLFGPPTL